MMGPDLFSGIEAVPTATRQRAAASLPHASTGFTLTVAQLNSMVREVLESAFPPVWVSGEISGWKRYPSGHCYFSLRDSDAQVRAVMFRNEANRLPADPKDGMEVRVLGSLSLYEKRGEYQFIARELEARSAGGLWRLAFEQTVAKLQGEGLLAETRKRTVPRCPGTVGVVTSPVGAALHDILTVIGRRAPWTRVVFSPARVQGDGAAADIVRAIGMLAREGSADVIIVGRGGGSVEDLWAFNEEAVARAIASSPVPVISAVGHEVDITVADLVADLRAPTPSAAAERAVMDGEAVGREMMVLSARLARATERRLSERRGELMLLTESLDDAARSLVGRRADVLASVSARLQALSPLAVLSRGYAVPQNESGAVLRTMHDFPDGSGFRLRVADGIVPCRVEGEPRDA